jgi:hypothetical protein
MIASPSYFSHTAHLDPYDPLPLLLLLQLHFPLLPPTPILLPPPLLLLGQKPCPKAASY